MIRRDSADPLIGVLFKKLAFATIKFVKLTILKVFIQYFTKLEYVLSEFMCICNSVRVYVSVCVYVCVCKCVRDVCACQCLRVYVCGFT